MPMRKRLPNKPNKNKNHRAGNNHKVGQQRIGIPTSSAADTAQSHSIQQNGAQAVAAGHQAPTVEEEGEGSDFSSDTDDFAPPSISPPAPTPLAIHHSRTKRSSSSTPASLAARIFVSPYNPRNLPSLILAILASLCHMAIAMGLGKLWGRSALAVGEGSGNVDGDVDMGVELGDVGGEGRVQGVEGEGRKVKRRKKGSVDKPSHYPGMMNLSGTLCYMNSVLQALASVSSLITHLDRIYALAEQVDEPSMVSDALADVLRILNTAHTRSPKAIRPNDLLVALYELPAIRRLLSTREQQDAHELFMVLAEAVGNESVRVAKVVARSKGLGEVVSLQGYAAATEARMPGGHGSGSGSGSGRINKWQSRARDEKVRGLAHIWEGLMARKRTCQVCGWSEGVRMDSLGGMELSLPQYGDVSLESCISQYLAPEHLTDVTCEMCSLKRTHLHYAAEVERLSHPAKTGAGSTSRSADTPHTPSHSGSFAALNGLSTAADTFDDSPSSSIDISPARRKRAKEAKKVEVRLQRMLESGTVAHYGESTLPGPPDSVPLPIKWQTSRTPSVREGLVTRPPQVLRLHLIRSEYTPYGQLLKKTARVAFPVFLDMTPFVSSGVWDQRTGVLGALQGQGQAGSRAEAQPQGQVQVQVPDQKRVIYRLSSVILHYGYTHSSGHYVCIRRKPVRVTSAPTQAGQSGVGSHLHSSSISASANVDSDAHNDGTRPDVPSTATKSCPDGCRCEDCVYFGQARELDAVPGRGWLSISDADVEEVGVEALVEARAQVSMLFYELVGEYPGPERVDDN